MMLMDHAYRRIPYELSQYVQEREPSTLKEMGTLADKRVDMKGRKWLASITNSDQKHQKGKRPPKQPKPGNDGKQKGKIECFNCGEEGHTKPQCTKPKKQNQDKKDQAGQGHNGATPKPAFLCDSVMQENTHLEAVVEPFNSQETANAKSEPWYIDRNDQINGMKATIFRDSACDQSMVSSKFVKDSDYIGNIKVKGVTGSASLPLAQVLGKSLYFSGKMTAAVNDHVDRDMLLGNDVAEDAALAFKDMVIGRDINTSNSEPSSETFAVTRAQAKANQKQDELTAKSVANSGVKSKTVETVPTMTKTLNESTGAHSTQNTNNNDVTQVVVQDDDCTGNTHQPLTDLNITPSELQKAQGTDTSLIGIHDRAIPFDQVENHRVCFYKKDGILYRNWSSITNKSPRVQQVVVPQQFRSGILRLSHDIPISGHLGVNKTRNRILANFYWPGIFSDVATYCRTCDTCQKTAKFHNPQIAPLHPLPIVGAPFQRIGIDILGPLPRTPARKAYILVVCDYGTRFPFAIPLANIEAGTIAEALIGIFSDFGIPKEIQSDQGTDFTAKLTKELYHMLGIDPVFSTPYHAATNGLVENFVGTMKSMIRSLSEVELKTWDKYIPLFLFAYREVPHDSLGFSPFELVFGRSVRGPLDIIRSVWTGTSTTDKNVVHYIIDLRDKLSLMTKAAHQNQAQAQTKQKTWYGKKAKGIEYQPGQKVLVLIPSERSKIGAQWKVHTKSRSVSMTSTMR